MTTHDKVTKLRRTGYFDNGTGPFERSAKGGKFPGYVVKNIDQDLAKALQKRGALDSIPRIQFANATNVVEKRDLRQIYLSPNDEPGMVRQESTFEGTFSTPMPMHGFPFDCHVLKITICLPSRVDYGRKLVTIPDMIEVNKCIDLEEWDRFEPHIALGKEKTAEYTIISKKAAP